MTTETFAELTEILPEPVMLVSSDGEILSANRAFLHALIETRENLAGKNLTQISNALPEKTISYLRNCSRSRQMVIGALSLQNTRGENLEYRCEGAVVELSSETGAAKIFLRLKPKDAAAGKFILLTQKINELNKEIFERKRAEEESRRLYLKASEANRLKDDFLATISHELRTPLNSILGWSQILRSNNLDEEQITKALETIERSARSQNQLVEDLLDVSRIITGKLRLDVCPVEIVSVVKSAVDTVRPTAENKSVRLEIVIDPRVGLVSGDAERLQQAIWNLLSNAIKFTPKNGRVQVRLERVNSHIEITVSDTGAGIESDFLPHIFDRFSQADMSKSRKYGGLGLGLAIVRHLVELHGGTIHAYSAGTEKGATFTLKLPLIIVNDAARFPDENGKRAHPTALEGVINSEIQFQLENLKLLVVDDSPDAREMMHMMLKSCGAEVSLASSVAEAMVKLQNNYFDILISDVAMPEEDGYALIAKIRNSAEADYRKIAAIALTAHARVADRLQLLSAGFDSHVAKPFEPAELIAIIASLARRTKDN